ncbi:MAG: sensor histidine kinase [Candidatus Cloacimonetes bacterium]|nr:sensor histidine kinase [Candidatus Cloacimonadota bacterium]
MTELQFKISSALKNIIGRDLITDDLIAVFELIKNSYDAYSKKVEITLTESELIIQDNGKGMDYDDLIEKWLFVAYSAKNEGSEDIKLKNKDFTNYRNKIKPRKYYAGAKGVGRFSCDRLGSKLTLITKSSARNSVPQKLVVDWDNFEEDSKKEFVNIPVIHTRVGKFGYEVSHGTILEISGLRSKWNRDKILKLKRSLEKLINPYDYFKTKKNVSTDEFSIVIKAEHELSEDSIMDFDQDKVNGPVKNFIFETLSIKTTQVVTTISENGKYITTKLVDRDKGIYKIRERNSKLYPTLRNIKFHLFYLNRSAKLNFHKSMGIRPVSFGSIFLYKNAFRVFPFGEEGEDDFKIDRRHAQGIYRTLGLRDLIGRIEIYGDNQNFTETTSRDGGLIETKAYHQLVACFMDKCFKRLERYVVDIQWSVGDSGEDIKLISRKDSKAKIINLVSKLVDLENIELVNYNKNFLNIISDRIRNDFPPVFDNLKKLASKSDDQKYLKEITLAEKEYKKIKKAEEAAHRKAKKEKEKRTVAEAKKRKAEEAYETERKKNLFFNTIKTNSKADIGLIHQIKLTSQGLNNRVRILTNDIIKNRFNKNKALKVLSGIKLLSEKVLKLSEIVTVSDLNFKYSKHSGDIVKFIEEYINEFKPTREIKLSINSDGTKYIKDFSVLEFSVIIDNLISNSIKAKARRIIIDISKRKKGVKIVFSDDGKGVGENIKDEIFDLGFTTTRGSGIGLFTVKDLLKNGDEYIKFIGNGQILTGASFEIGL